MKEKVKVGVVGFGARGMSLLKRVMLEMNDVSVLALCELREERLEKAAKAVEEVNGERPFCTSDYDEILKIEELDAIVINTGWRPHIELAIKAMNAGKYAAIEVGGANTLYECYHLVEAYEKTGMPCMMLENCCYGQKELLALNMVKKGLFGELVHCAGGYHHDILAENLFHEEGHYRLNEYVHRNCDNYPTHELGPIAKILDINRGNRMLTLSSTASKAVGINHFAKTTYGEEHPLANKSVAQGDIITTVIKCARGETITLTLDTTLPRAFYSRGLVVRGTLGMFDEDTKTVYLEGMEEGVRGNQEQMEATHGHPIWQNYDPKGGHGGMDWLVFEAFFDSVKKGINTPIDAYDTAAWASISVLSEQSVTLGGTPLPIPDFTNGKWTDREPAIGGKFCLD